MDFIGLERGALRIKRVEWAVSDAAYWAFYWWLPLTIKLACLATFVLAVTFSNLSILLCFTILMTLPYRDKMPLLIQLQRMREIKAHLVAKQQMREIRWERGSPLKKKDHQRGELSLASDVGGGDLQMIEAAGGLEATNNQEASKI